MPWVQRDQQSQRRHGGRLAFTRSVDQQRALSHAILAAGEVVLIIAALAASSPHARVPGHEFPCSNTDMKLAGMLSLLFLTCSWMLAGQNPTENSTPAADYSGMYSFLREGEFVQITVEDAGKVTGFVSRYGDSESDR